MRTLRLYAASCVRLDKLQAGDPCDALYRELRANSTLLRALRLED